MESPEDHEIMSVEIFDRTTGEIKAVLEVLEEDFQRYVLLAQVQGISIEEFFEEALLPQLTEAPSQWATPQVGEDGEITMEGAVPVAIPRNFGAAL